MPQAADRARPVYIWRRIALWSARLWKVLEMLLRGALESPLSLILTLRRLLASLASASIMAARNHGLVRKLQSLSESEEKKKRRLVKPVDYEVERNGKVWKVRSWRMSEWDYYKVPCPLPTLARGLFTTREPGWFCKGLHRIAARGYDKFFNIGEVPWTSVCTVHSYSALF